MLDEIGDLPMPLQAKLLRFLQERVIERVGGRQEIPIDVRVVGATHQDLKARIADGRFREDLYYRLAEIVVEIPPLRERLGDPVLLSHAFARRFATEMRRPVPTLGDDAVRALEAHRWPGNVRELQNMLKRAVIMCEDDRITAPDLSLRAATEPADDNATLDLRTVRENAERQALITALARTDGNIVRAAEMLGISRPTLYDMMNRLQIK
jgi:two-component system NtrC family response regulator